MNETHDKILELQDTDLNFKLLPLFFDLKNFPDVNFEIPDKKNLFFIFLDGLDEISETNKIALAHKLQVTADTYKNIRFIIAGRDGGFSSEITTALKNTKTLLLIPYNDTSDIKLSNLLKTYDDSPLSDFIVYSAF